MSRPRSESAEPATATLRRRRRALTYDDLLPELKAVIRCVKCAEFSSTMPPRRASRRERVESAGPRTSRIGHDAAEIEPFERR